MAQVTAEVQLEIDETNEKEIKSNAIDFLKDALIEQAPDNAIEGNSVRNKPTFRIDEVEHR